MLPSAFFLSVQRDGWPKGGHPKLSAQWIQSGPSVPPVFGFRRVYSKLD